MNGDPQATSARLPAAVPRWRWSSWITRRRERRQGEMETRLELIASLSTEERRGRQSGEYFPDVRSAWRWY